MLFISYFLSKAITSATLKVESVIVPVLSRQNVSMLAKVSIPFSFWMITFFFAIFMMPTDDVMLVSKISPDGIIPITPATVDKMA